MYSAEKADSMLLLACGNEYLRYERRCYLVTWQRSPWPKIRPDILGVTTGRKTIEIEVKLTLPDFRANAHKRGVRLRARGRHCPHQFYFLVPRQLVEKVRAELPEGAGLMTIGSERRISGTVKIEVVVGATMNRRAVRLSLPEMVNLVRHQSGTLCSAAAKLARLAALRRAGAPTPETVTPALNELRGSRSVTAQKSQRLEIKKYGKIRRRDGCAD